MAVLDWGALAGVTMLAFGGALGATGRGLRAGLAVQAEGMMILGVVGVAVLTGGDVLGAGFRSSVGLAFGLDPLSGFFLAVLALTAVPTLIFARDYLPGSHGARALAALTAAFLLSLVGVLAARDVIGFLGFWELPRDHPVIQFVDDQLRTGHDIIARDRATGEKQLVKLLTAPERQAAAAGAAHTGGGRAGRARWWPKGRHRRQLPVPSRPRKPTVPRRARLPVLACGFRYLAWLVLEVRS